MVRALALQSNMQSERKIKFFATSKNLYPHPLSYQSRNAALLAAGEGDNIIPSVSLHLLTSAARDVSPALVMFNNEHPRLLHDRDCDIRQADRPAILLVSHTQKLGMPCVCELPT